MNRLQLVALAVVLVSPLAVAQPLPNNCTRPSAACTSAGFFAIAPSGSYAMRINPGAKIGFDGPAGINYFLRAIGSTATFTNMNVSASGAFSSTTGAGANAFAVGVNGARIDYGTGANDHASSDGTTVTFAGPLATSSTLSTIAQLTASTFYLSGSAFNGSVGRPFTVDDAEGLAVAGVATVNLAACNNTAPPLGTRGTIQFDITTTTYKWCNGSAWVEVGSSAKRNSVLGSHFSGLKVDAVARPFDGFRAVNEGTVPASTGMTFTPMVVGVGAGSITFEVYNTSGASLCSLAVSCTAAIETPVTSGNCAGGAIAAGNIVHIRYSSGCTTNPIGNLTSQLQF